MAIRNGTTSTIQAQKITTKRSRRRKNLLLLLAGSSLETDRNDDVESDGDVDIDVDVNVNLDENEMMNAKNRQQEHEVMQLLDDIAAHENNMDENEYHAVQNKTIQILKKPKVLRKAAKAICKAMKRGAPHKQHTNSIAEILANCIGIEQHIQERQRKVHSIKNGKQNQKQGTILATLVANQTQLPACCWPTFIGSIGKIVLSIDNIVMLDRIINSAISTDDSLLEHYAPAFIKSMLVICKHQRQISGHNWFPTLHRIFHLIPGNALLDALQIMRMHLSIDMTLAKWIVAQYESVPAVWRDVDIWANIPCDLDGSGFPLTLDRNSSPYSNDCVVRLHSLLCDFIQSLPVDELRFGRLYSKVWQEFDLHHVRRDFVMFGMLRAVLCDHVDFEVFGRSPNKYCLLVNRYQHVLYSLLVDSKSARMIALERACQVLIDNLETAADIPLVYKRVENVAIDILRFICMQDDENEYGMNLLIQRVLSAYIVSSSDALPDLMRALIPLLNDSSASLLRTVMIGLRKLFGMHDALTKRLAIRCYLHLLRSPHVGTTTHFELIQLVVPALDWTASVSMPLLLALRDIPMNRRSYLHGTILRKLRSLMPHQQLDLNRCVGAINAKNESDAVELISNPGFLLSLVNSLNMNSELSETVRNLVLQLSSIPDLLMLIDSTSSSSQYVEKKTMISSRCSSAAVIIISLAHSLANIVYRRSRAAVCDGAESSHEFPYTVIAFVELAAILQSLISKHSEVQNGFDFGLIDPVYHTLDVDLLVALLKAQAARLENVNIEVKDLIASGELRPHKRASRPHSLSCPATLISLPASIYLLKVAEHMVVHAPEHTEAIMPAIAALYSSTLPSSIYGFSDEVPVLVHRKFDAQVFIDGLLHGLLAKATDNEKLFAEWLPIALEVDRQRLLSKQLAMLRSRVLACFVAALQSSTSRPLNYGIMHAKKTFLYGPEDPIVQCISMYSVMLLRGMCRLLEDSIKTFELKMYLQYFSILRRCMSIGESPRWMQLILAPEELPFVATAPSSDGADASVLDRVFEQDNFPNQVAMALQVLIDDLNITQPPELRAMYRAIFTQNSSCTRYVIQHVFEFKMDESISSNNANVADNGLQSTSRSVKLACCLEEIIFCLRQYREASRSSKTNFIHHISCTKRDTASAPVFVSPSIAIQLCHSALHLLTEFKVDWPGSLLPRLAIALHLSIQLADKTVASSTATLHRSFPVCCHELIQLVEKCTVFCKQFIHVCKVVAQLSKQHVEFERCIRALVVLRSNIHMLIAELHNLTVCPLTIGMTCHDLFDTAHVTALKDAIEQDDFDLCFTTDSNASLMQLSVDTGFDPDVQIDSDDEVEDYAQLGDFVVLDEDYRRNRTSRKRIHRDFESDHSDFSVRV